MKSLRKTMLRPILSVSILAISIVSQTAWPQTSQSSTNSRTETSSVSGVSAEMAAFGSRGIRVHDPSTIVKCKNEYWVFYTGNGVPSYHSEDLINWDPGPRVFTNAPAWVNGPVPGHRGAYFWAPDVMKVGGRYLLYYAVSTFGTNVSAIGLATNPTLDPADPAFKWTDQGEVIRSVRTNNFNTIDPAICTYNGELWLSFGSFWSGIKLIQLDPKTGKRISPDSPMYSLAHFDSIEASYIYPHDGYFYLFVNWGKCCVGINSTYNIRVGRSTKITGPYLDQNGVDMLDNGGTLLLDSHNPFIGPGHAGIISVGGKDWFSCHFYDATRAGRPTLAILPLKWDANGWPKIELPQKPKE